MLDKIKFNEKGLIPTIIQDERSKKVLTLCYMNQEALDKTLKEGKVYVFRRSKGKLMLKGETSGHTQAVKEVYIDCEGNSILFVIDQNVAACHAGYFTCYYRKVNKQGKLEITDKQVFNPGDKYK
ncbi:MAG: phosphoribosyl-AMP cyclohydrolase [Candidatus Omnitrophica bacterium]|nr:phosphoribosyl-AMP cyclohydrolase [Candidatus Omnitrophota bacterium]